MERVHRHPYYDEDVVCTPIGPTVCLRETNYSDGRLAGFLIAHDAPDLPHRCEGGITVAHPSNPSVSEEARPTWTMTGSLAGGDLSLQPSVLCSRDQFHGYVTNGAWV